MATHGGDPTLGSFNNPDRWVKDGLIYKDSYEVIRSNLEALKRMYEQTAAMCNNKIVEQDIKIGNYQDDVNSSILKMEEKMEDLLHQVDSLSEKIDLLLAAIDSLAQDVYYD